MRPSVRGSSCLARRDEAAGPFGEAILRNEEQRRRAIRTGRLEPGDSNRVHSGA